MRRKKLDDVTDITPTTVRDAVSSIRDREVTWIKATTVAIAMIVIPARRRPHVPV